MPVTRCPHCALRMRVNDEVVGRLVGCSRCQQTFEAYEQSAASRFGELFVVAAAVLVGALASWLIVNPRP